MKINKIKKRKGITLIELMIVLVILGIVMTALVVNLQDAGPTDAARQIQLKSAKGQLDMALFRFKTQFGRLPSTEEGLKALVEAPPGVDENYPSGGFLNNKASLLDPWQNPYAYELTGSSKYKIISYGADGDIGGEGEDADIDLSEIQ